MPALLRPKETDAAPCDVSSDPFVQNLFVLCHGEQVGYKDHGEKNPSGALRPWDPPLSDHGKLQAWRVGRTIRLEDWNVTRVVVSPFLQCVQTAAEVIAGLCLMPSSVTQLAAADAAGESHPSLSTSSIKVTIECGLAEMTRGTGVTYPLDQSANGDSLQPWTLDLPELYSMLPPEVQDSYIQPIHEKLPSSSETAAEVHHRYTSTFQKIANIYPYENILCITHGEGVRQSVSMMWPAAEVDNVLHCAFTHGQRPNFESEDGTCIVNGDQWELLTESGPASGVYFSPPNLHQW